MQLKKLFRKKIPGMKKHRLIKKSSIVLFYKYFRETESEFQDMYMNWLVKKNQKVSRPISLVGFKIFDVCLDQNVEDFRKKKEKTYIKVVNKV